MKGFFAYIIKYKLDVTAHKDEGTASRFEHPGVSLTENLNIEYVPIFNFAIFYNPLMEIAPGPFMEVLWRVHANSNAYFQSQNGLDFKDRVSIAGDIYHGRYPGSGQANNDGNVTFLDGQGQSNMKRGDSDGWLDSRDKDLASASSDRWKGNVSSSSHGVDKLNLPIPENPHDLIERANPSDTTSLKNEKFEYKADLKILSDSSGNISAKNGSGHAVNLSFIKDGRTTSVVTRGRFYDQREQRFINTIDVNLRNLKDSGVYPDNGILYVSNESYGGDMGAVRLTNGETLPKSQSATGFSVATDDPLYVQGNFNTKSKTLSMIAGDAITILSNNWKDSNSAKSSTEYSKRLASDTTINAVCINGIVPSGSNFYSGGVENFFRLLENWNGKKLSFKGSIIELWLSEIARGNWRYGSPVYDAPIRSWSWDAALGGMNGPPGAPRVVRIKKTQWSVSSNEG